MKDHRFFVLAPRQLACGVAALALAGALGGCATGPQANPQDPLEPLNRGIFKINDASDRAIIRPLAGFYQSAVPSPVRTGIRNFFSNLDDAWSFVNNLLQFKGEAAGNSLMRFAVNTGFGLGGLLDIATEMQIDAHPEDLGQTLGRWGVGAGPYLMLPLLGPSSVRDAGARFVQLQGEFSGQVAHVPTRNSLVGVKLLDDRSQLLEASRMLDQMALDPYSFVRDAYLQRRLNAVYDGDPPQDAAGPGE